MGISDAARLAAAALAFVILVAIEPELHDRGLTGSGFIAANILLALSMILASNAVFDALDKNAGRPAGFILRPLASRLSGVAFSAIAFVLVIVSLTTNVVASRVLWINLAAAAIHILPGEWLRSGWPSHRVESFDGEY